MTPMNSRRPGASRGPTRTSAIPLAALILILLSAVPAVAQEGSPAASFDDLVEVSEVLLDVLVTDKKGNVIVGLGPDDFVRRGGRQASPGAIGELLFEPDRAPTTVS